MDAILGAAVEKAACPICFEDLSSKSDEVGALTCRGRRVEAALYHQSCVGAGPGRKPKLPHNVSPITRKPIDGFILLPSLDDKRAWVKFVDWNGDGKLDVSEVANVIAAMLPVDEDRVESFVRKTFDADGNGFISDKELENLVIPYLQTHSADLTAEAASSPPPELSRNSSRAELLAWFNHWDADRSGSLDALELRYALTSCFYRALGADVDVATKQGIVEFFFAEADANGDQSVCQSEFLERLAPALQINLPDSQTSTSGGNELRVRLVAAPVGTVREVVLSRQSAVGELRREAQDHLRTTLRPQLFVGGQRLENDAELVRNISGLQKGLAVQTMVPSAAASRPGARTGGLVAPAASAGLQVPPWVMVVAFVAILAWLLSR